jgi:hypothetical protein
MQPRREIGDTGDCEIEIFEKTEEEKIDGHGNDQEKLASAGIGGAAHS